MKQFLAIYGSSLLTFLVVDLAWIKWVVGPMFERKLGSLMLETPRMAPALLFYCLFVLGNVIFVVYPGLDESVFLFTGRALLYGLICYATYELTNYATLADWPLSLVVLDLAWGAGISTLVAWTGIFVGSKGLMLG